MRYVALSANVAFSVWSLAFIIASGHVGRTGAVLSVFHWIAWGGLPVAFLSFVTAGLYYGAHIRRNKRLTLFSRFFWMLSPGLCFFPYFLYWVKYVWKQDGD